jgi:hypothetical protein
VQQNKDGELKLFNQFGRFSFIISFTCITLFAGSFADFKRVQSQSFHTFKDQRDNKFNKYLREQWDEYKVSISPKMYEKNKPKSIPAFAQKKSVNVGPHLVIDIKQASLTKEHIQKQKRKGTIVSFAFFGEKVAFNFDKSIQSTFFYPRTQKRIGDFFSVMAASDYSQTLEQINSTCKQMNLNDWGLYLLVTKLSENVFSTPDEQKLLSWFLFSKLGFRVKIALNGDKHLLLLYATKEVMYDTPSYTIAGKRFYVISHYDKAKVGNIYTYEHMYPHATQALEFRLKKLPYLKKNYKHKYVSFKENEKIYTFSYRYNQNLVDFMATYPQVAYSVYFNAPLEYETYYDIAKNLKKYIKKKKASEALNFVLHFVQKAFVYERDETQFHREKVMFAEETLYYAKSDCEDRAVLYARLVKDLFGIGVVGVKYQNHMSTALKIPLQGDSVRVASQKYVIADPTYINASVGQNIAKYKSVVPENFIHVN